MCLDSPAIQPGKCREGIGAKLDPLAASCSFRQGAYRLEVISRYDAFTRVRRGRSPRILPFR